MSDWEHTTLGQLFSADNTRLGAHTDEPTVMSLSKYDGFVRADDYFDKRIASEKLDGYKFVEPGGWAYSTIHIDEGSIARNNMGEAGVISPMYTTLRWRGEGAALPEYAELVVRSPRMLAEYANNAQGSVNRRRSLPFKIFSAIPISLPPLSVQERIVEIIAAVDGQITALEAEVEAVVKVRTGLVGRSADTGKVPLGSLGVVSQGKGLPKESQGKRTGEVSWYKIADMTGPGNEFGYTVADTRLTPSEVAGIGGVVVNEGAVTFPRVGAAVLTEKKRIVDTPGALDENHLVITPGEGTNSEYLLAVMENFALSSLVRPGAVPSLNMGLIRSTKVPWSGTENQSLGTALGALRAESRVLTAEAASLRATRAVLLTGLLDRTIDVDSAELLEV